jgi:hypothetical protein
VWKIKHVLHRSGLAQGTGGGCGVDLSQRGEVRMFSMEVGLLPLS